MSKILEAFTTLYPDQIWLEVSPEEIEKKWPLEQEYSYDVARWNAFLNRLTLDVFLRWIEEESGIEEQPEVWPSLEDLPSIWEVVNGTAIKLGGTRIVLMTSGETDTNEFCVPAEWVDIPSWAADYYLAVQVNPDDCWLRVWGYTTHKKLKAGEYSNIRRTYSLEREELIEDLNVMWVARELGGDRKAAIKPLPTLSPAQAENLLEQLSQPSSYSPRLKVVDFAQWGAFIENETLRQQLYKQRIVVATRWVNLSEWFQNFFESGWHAVEDVLAPTELIPVLGAKNPGGEGETRWQAAISLGKVDPGNPEAGRQRAKLIDLGMELGGHPLALSVALMPKADGGIDVLLRVQFTSTQTPLPAGLKLYLLSASGETIKEVEPRSDATGQGMNSWIQIAFSARTHFRVKVTFNNISFTESFAIYVN